MQQLRLHMHYMHKAHSGILQKCKKKITWKIIPASLLERHTSPFLPLPLFLLCKILLRVKIYILTLVYLEINFPAELMLKINNMSRQNLPAPPPHNQMVVPLPNI